MPQQRRYILQQKKALINLSAHQIPRIKNQMDYVETVRKITMEDCSIL